MRWPHPVQESELARARRDLEELVERMFASPAWRASPAMAAIEDASRALQGQAAEVGVVAGTAGMRISRLLACLGRRRERVAGRERPQPTPGV